jgi:UPF0176 protein
MKRAPSAAADPPRSASRRRSSGTGPEPTNEGVVVNTSGYKFVTLGSPPELDALRDKLVQTCNERPELRGTILLGEEGVNIQFSGFEEDVKAIKAALPSVDQRLGTIHYKDTFGTHRALAKMSVRVKTEIIPMGDPSATPNTLQSPATHLDPAEFKRWMDEKRDVVVLDTRNDYEIRLGTFDGAVDLGIKSFRAFPEAVKQSSLLGSGSEDKPVVMFCTGGVRCEKAAFALAQCGRKNLYQLNGGIINYLAEVGPKHYNGECYVFDHRVSLTADLKESTSTTQCFACRAPLTEHDRAHQAYVEGQSCSYCIDAASSSSSSSASAPSSAPVDASDSSNINTTGGNVSTPISAAAVIAAARDGDLGSVSALWKQDPSLFRLATDRHGSNALHFAAGCGHVEICAHLVRICGLPAAHRNRRGRTALHWAARNGKIEVCQLLVGELKIDPNCCARGGVSPLQLAVWQCHEQCARWLAAAGADVQIVNDFGCSTAHWCAMSGTADAQSVKRMCTWLHTEHSMDFGAPNDQGHTALHKAAFAGNRAACEWMKEQSMLDSAQDHAGNYAADKAEQGGHAVLASWLRQECSPCKAEAYTRLEVEPGCGPTLLKNAYRQAIRKVHPDRFGTEAAGKADGELFHAVQHAYDFLREIEVGDADAKAMSTTLGSVEPQRMQQRNPNHQRHLALCNGSSSGDSVVDIEEGVAAVEAANHDPVSLFQWRLAILLQNEYGQSSNNVRGLPLSNLPKLYRKVWNSGLPDLSEAKAHSEVGGKTETKTKCKLADLLRRMPKVVRVVQVSATHVELYPADCSGDASGSTAPEQRVLQGLQCKAIRQQSHVEEQRALRKSRKQAEKERKRQKAPPAWKVAAKATKTKAE